MDPQGAAPGPQGLLEVQNIEALYGGAVLAVRDVSLKVGKGAIVALLGANGAGKTTVLKAISNLLGPERGAVSRGAIRWDGEAVDRLSAADLVGRGVVQVLEGRRVFSQLTVEENILAGSYGRRPRAAERRRDLEQVYSWFPRLRDKRGTKAGLTSGGEQQMVAISRALMTKPRLVLLDEPSMGLAPIVVQEIFEIVRSLNTQSGASFLVAEQNANLALRYAAYAYVLETGRVAAEGTAADLLSRGDIHDLYFGGGSGSVALH
ncbi:branched-chain amino acid ABC transporter ATP-binding protein [Aureimonas ureilytica]|uniref:Branched-chain amino acid ABC transporter ATP-binding protein n=1 Tax=Aureimonas ureilytica TaxID=401562 RepID=A0A175R476_9HYPH|nr:branched-chain amino acid ABC transporter ATP-binding protein [Aureimonas ureilytica]